jgi:hypothetical protein
LRLKIKRRINDPQEEETLIINWPSITPHSIPEIEIPETEHIANHRVDKKIVS